MCDWSTARPARCAKRTVAQNWRLRDGGDGASSRKITVQSLALNNATMRDAVQDLELDATGVTRVDGNYQARTTFKGRWRGQPLGGTVDTGHRQHETTKR